MLGTPFNKQKMQGRGQAGSHYETTRSVEKSSSDSQSDFVAVFVPPSVRTELVVSYLAFLDTSKATLELGSGRYFIIY